MIGVGTVLLIILIFALFGGGFAGVGGAPYAGYGYGVGGLLLIVLLVLLLTGHHF